MWFISSNSKLPKIAKHILLLTAILTNAGCGGTNLLQFYFGDLFVKGSHSSSSDKNAAQLASEGTKNMRDKDYGGAIKAFQKLKEQYPYSKYAILAELKLGDAHFYKKQYNEASLAYEEFARLHPRNEVVPYVLYQIGMCHFLNFTTIDRDPQETLQAMESFQRVIQTYPESEYAQKATKQLFECHKRIVAHEFYVGQFYYHLGEFHASKERLEKISRDYPQAVKELGYRDEISKMCSTCERHEIEGGKKPSIWTRLGF